MTDDDFQRGVRAGMLIGMEESVVALEARRGMVSAALIRKAIAAHIERYPETAELATLKKGA
jgi:hypothetical protein